MHFEPTRAAGLARLSDFLPRAGRDYANSRNYDDGVPEDGARRNVSQLSPWLHAGLIDEGEVLDAVLAEHSPRTAEKFISEVFWRIYFKGYLEQRPGIWRGFCEQRDRSIGELDDNAGLRRAYEEATGGRTGIEAFDHWARELVETGYLHNHARMWFASIWIFTLKLDWTLGADFFLRHLMDGDAASNTLSWRWVGGLHTTGKTYLARESNIARYTANMTAGPLEAQGLASEAPALSEGEEYGRQGLALPDRPARDAFDAPYALILHDEAASHVPLALPRPPDLVIGAPRPEARSSREIGSHARAFARGAVENGLAEAADTFGCERRMWEMSDDLSNQLAAAGLKRIAIPFLPTGWIRDALMPELAPIFEQGDAIDLLGDLDRATWPHAKAGFFGVKKKIEGVLAEVGITG
ncbi:FAD-binding domain-containing protein [Erythrobacter sp. THAF29]|uniref:FAD-binding domain-containing protein n=1 Tax=Erythrobacter sp. THAF29 TaxID=2587851 RepID=UPI0012689ABA|nr:FAD-binding domain-containing protein [Erythrobacter sp. THAF29]QFT78797.1 Deoxyribodipyrimidine photo-lyase [Erythrobacter sp. THAF29]